MPRSTSWVRALLVSLVLPNLAACATLTIDADTPISAKQFARNVPRVKPDPDDTCQTQRNVAKQDAYLDSIIDGKERIYKADCDLPKKKKKVPAVS